MGCVSTVTVSDSDATFIVTSAVTSPRACTRTLRCTTVANPLSSTVSGVRAGIDVIKEVAPFLACRAGDGDARGIVLQRHLRARHGELGFVGEVPCTRPRYSWPSAGVATSSAATSAHTHRCIEVMNSPFSICWVSNGVAKNYACCRSMSISLQHHKVTVAAGLTLVRIQ